MVQTSGKKPCQNHVFRVFFLPFFQLNDENKMGIRVTRIFSDLQKRFFFFVSKLRVFENKWFPSTVL